LAAIFKVLSHNGQQADAMTKIIPLEKRQFILVSEGIKQGLKVQDK
jgi:hypothetical protein